jgi:hypothetical protein
VLPLLPAVIRYDRQAQRGVPKRWPEAGQFLRERTGHDFPALARLHSARARRTMASILCDNLDPALSVVGLEVKVLAAAVFAEIVGDEGIANAVQELARHRGVQPDQLEAAIKFAREVGNAAPAAGATAALLTLARAASPSPAQINGVAVAACRSAELSPAAIVETVTWLSVLEALHRLTCFTDGASP